MHARIDGTAAVSVAVRVGVAVAVLRVTPGGVAMVSPGFGFEWEHLVPHGQPHLLDHVIEDVVGLVADAPQVDLKSHVPITEVIRRARQFEGIGAMDDGQGLALGAHHEHLASVAGETVTILERRPALNVDSHHFSIRGDDPTSRLLTRVEVHLQVSARLVDRRAASNEVFHRGFSSRRRRAGTWRVMSRYMVQKRK